MLRYRFAIGTVAVAFALGAAPAQAQENPPAGGPASRSAGSAERVGTATARGGDASGGVAEARGGANSGGSTNTGGGMSGGGSMGSSSTPSTPPSSGTRSWDAPMRSWEAPVRLEDRAQRSQGAQGRTGEATGRTAAPRSGGESGGTSRTPSTPAVSSGGSTDRVSAPDRRAVPANSRPRDGRIATGEAIDRRTRPPGTGARDILFLPIRSPFYNPYGFFSPGFGLGLGYLYYDPFWYGGYGGYGYGGGYGGYDPGGTYSASQYGYRETGSVRLRISPSHAQVFVDGYYVGDVDGFNGIFQRLRLDAGPRRIEIKADGYETVELDVLVTPGETITYRGEMKRIQ